LELDCEAEEVEVELPHVEEEEFDDN